MATKYRCYKKCFAYNKLFKKGEMFPQAWLEAKYIPPPEYFVLADEYEDKVSEADKNERIIHSAADDPRPSVELVKELTARMGDIPKDWNRKRVWSELRRRELADSKTEPRKPGRPPKE